ncbi:MAG: hypothetical protein HKO62_05820 [Gammaproteobacteria bacterium]|nr:hypothetical protein [Gammaproteobacteria bacterium]
MHGLHKRVSASAVAASALAWIPTTIGAEDFSTAFMDAVRAIPEQHWATLNTNRFQNAWPELERRQFDPAGQRAGPKAVIRAFSSFAWDRNRKDVIIYGGGHGNYPGNEVYRWRSSTLRWERGSIPSQTVLIDGQPLSGSYNAIDGYLNAPPSAHTYDNNEYLPLVDRFVTLGGAAWNTGGSFQYRNDQGQLRRTGPYFWNPALGDPDKVGGSTGSHVNPAMFPDTLGGMMWDNRQRALSSSSDQYSFIEGATAYAEYVDGNTGEVFDSLWVSTRQNLWQYIVHDADDPTGTCADNEGDCWILSGTAQVPGVDGTWGQGAAAVDPDREVFVRAAGNQLYYYDLANPGPSNPAVPILISNQVGAPFAANFRSAGLDYDPEREHFILWAGFEGVWALIPPDPLAAAGWTTERLETEALPEFGTPDRNDSGDSTFTGILGKWKYIPEADLYMGFYHVKDGDIWVYKPENWNPTFGALESEPAVVPLWGAVPALVTGAVLVVIHRRRRLLQA